MGLEHLSGGLECLGQGSGTWQQCRKLGLDPPESSWRGSGDLLAVVLVLGTVR